MTTATLDRSLVERIVRQIVLQQMPSAQPAPSKSEGYKPNLVVSISARHCHLTDEHVEILFGPGHKLTPEKPLYQDGFYAAAETVMIVGPRRLRMKSTAVFTSLVACGSLTTGGFLSAGSSISFGRVERP